MTDQSLVGKTIFIDVGQGPQPFEVTELHGQHSQPEELKTEIQESAPEAEPSNARKNLKPKENLSLIIQERKFKCPECPRYAAEYQEKLDRHIKRKHRGENPFSCYMCEYSTPNKTLFEEHVYIHQGVKPYKCSHCDHACVSKKNMKKHERIHRPDNPLRCSQCTFIAQNRQSLKKHSASCKMAGVDVKAKASQSKKYLRCKNCKYMTTVAKSLDAHYKTCKGKKGNKFRCKLCHWSSKHNAKILLHLIHHPNQKVDDEIIDVSILRKHGIMV